MVSGGGGSADGLTLLVLAILVRLGQWFALSYVRIEARARVTPGVDVPRWWLKVLRISDRSSARTSEAIPGSVMPPLLVVEYGQPVESQSNRHRSGI